MIELILIGGQCQHIINVDLIVVIILQLLARLAPIAINVILDNVTMNLMLGLHLIALAQLEQRLGQALAVDGGGGDGDRVVNVERIV